MRAGVWALGSYGTSQAIRLASNLVLTRLLFREAFGLMALVGVFLQGLALFSDVGINRAIVQNKRGEEPVFLDTAWSIQIVRGFLLWLVAAAAAKPVALLYDAPQLAEVLPVAGFIAVISGFNSTKLFTQNRKLAQKSLALVEIGSQLLGTIVMVVLAMMWRSVWALVFGTMAVALARVVLSHTLLPGERNRFRIHRPDMKEMFQLGRWIFVSTALTFLGSQSDRLIFGKLVSLGTLGVYNIALTIATMPSILLNQLIWNVLFPVISRAFERGDDPNPSFLRARAPILLIGGFLTSTLIGAGPFIIDALYDARYTDAGWMLRMLAVSAWFLVLQTSLTSATIARGKAMAPAVTNAIKLAGLLVGVPLGHSLGGFPGAMVALIACELTGFIVMSTAAWRMHIRTIVQDATSSLRVIVSGATGVAFARFLHTILPQNFLGDVIGGVAILVLTALFWLPGAQGQIKALRGALGR